MTKETMKELEGHIGTIAWIIVIGLMTWNVNATSSLQQSQRDLVGEINLANEKIEFLKENFKTRTLDRYTGADAARDRAMVMSEINLLNLKVGAIEEKIHDKHPNNH